MLLHPAFDTKTNTWFVDDHEAPTLRELKEQIGPDTEFPDYYPMGLSKAIDIQRARNESRRRSSFIIRPLKFSKFTGGVLAKHLPEESVARRSKAECDVLRIAAIRLLETGRTTGEIAAELGCTRNSVSGIRARWRGKTYK